MSSVIVQRQPANRPGPDIIEPLLTDDVAKRERGRSDINRNEDDRKIFTGNGPKGQLIRPSTLGEINIRGRIIRGNMKMFSRTYSLSDNTYQINSSVSIETLHEANRPERVTP